MKTPGGVLLDFRDVHTHYGALHVLKGVSYEIREGEIVSLLGGNASGKSTTMKTVLGLVRPSEGTISFRGRADPRLCARARSSGAGSPRCPRAGACSRA